MSNRKDLLELIRRASVMLQEHGAAGCEDGCDLLTEMGEALMERVEEGTILESSPGAPPGVPVREVDLS